MKPKKVKELELVIKAKRTGKNYDVRFFIKDKEEFFIYEIIGLLEAVKIKLFSKALEEQEEGNHEA